MAKYYCIASSVRNLSFHNLFHLVHNKVYDEANTCTLKKMSRSTKLRGAQSSSKLGLRSKDFRAPENLIFPALLRVNQLDANPTK